jgi:purine-nucleoside phosphorylase
MKPIHIVTQKDNIAKNVLLPGDPLRAKYIADNFLKNAKLINTVRNMFGYTGTYKGKKVTVIGSGMGIPSVALYAQELYKFYDVNNIIRIGTAGAMNPSVHIRDVILVSSSYSDSNFAYELLKRKSKKVSSSNYLNQVIMDTSKEENLKIIKGTVYTTEVFDVYSPIDHLLNKIPKNINILACEMESYGLFNVAKSLNKNATCLLSISDSKFEPENELSAEQRQTSLNEMITLALESIIKTS